jgi:LemA protein
MTVAYIAMGLAVMLFVWTALAFNALVLAHNRVNESWSGVDVQLKRRHDLVPSLVETVRAYAEHESAILRAVTESSDTAAASSGRRGRQAAEYELSQAIAGARVLSESYPELRASEPFRRLQAQVAEVEGEIQYARRIYNANVQRYNSRVRSFPGSLVRRLGGYQATGYFELTPVHLNAASVSETTGRDEAGTSSAAVA